MLRAQMLTPGPVAAGTTFRVVFGRGVGEALIEDAKIDRLAHGRRQAGHEPLTLRLRGKSTTSPAAARCSFTPNCVPHGFLRLLTPALA
jgi:hypothetical protein